MDSAGAGSSFRSNQGDNVVSSFGNEVYDKSIFSLQNERDVGRARKKKVEKEVPKKTKKKCLCT